MAKLDGFICMRNKKKKNVKEQIAEHLCRCQSTIWMATDCITKSNFDIVINFVLIYMKNKTKVESDQPDKFWTFHGIEDGLTLREVGGNWSPPP